MEEGGRTRETGGGWKRQVMRHLSPSCVEIKWSEEKEIKGSQGVDLKDG